MASAGNDLLSPSYLCSLYVAELPPHLARHITFSAESVHEFQHHLTDHAIPPEVYGQWLHILTSKFAAPESLIQLTKLSKEAFLSDDRSLAGWGAQCFAILFRKYFEETVLALGGEDAIVDLMDGLPVVDVITLCRLLKESATRSAKRKTNDSITARRSIVTRILSKILPNNLSKSKSGNSNKRRNLFDAYQLLLVTANSSFVTSLLPQVAHHIRPHVWKELVREHPFTVGHFVLDQLRWTWDDSMVANPQFLQSIAFELLKTDNRTSQRFTVGSLDVDPTRFGFATTFGLAFIDRWCHMVQDAKKEDKKITSERAIFGENRSANDVNEFVYLLFRALTRDIKDDLDLGVKVKILSWITNTLEKIFSILGLQHWFTITKRSSLFGVVFSLWKEASNAPEVFKEVERIFSSLLKYTHAGSCFPLTTDLTSYQQKVLHSISRDKRFPFLQFIYLHLPEPYCKDISSLPSESLTLEEKKTASIVWCPTTLLGLATVDAHGCLERSRKFLDSRAVKISGTRGTLWKSVDNVVGWHEDADSLGLRAVEVGLKEKLSVQEGLKLLQKRCANEKDEMKRTHYVELILNMAAFSDDWDIFERTVRWITERFQKAAETRQVILCTLRTSELCINLLAGISRRLRSIRITSKTAELTVHARTIQASNDLIRFITIDWCTRCLKEPNISLSEYTFEHRGLLQACLDARKAHFSRVGQLYESTFEDLTKLSRCLFHDFIPTLLDFESLRLFQFRNFFGVNITDNYPISLFSSDLKILPSLCKFFDEYQSRREPLWREAKLQVSRQLQDIPPVFPVGVSHKTINLALKNFAATCSSKPVVELDWMPWTKGVIHKIIFQSAEELEYTLKPNELSELLLDNEGIWDFMKAYVILTKDQKVSEARLFSILTYWINIESPKGFVQRDFRLQLLSKLTKWYDELRCRKAFSPRILQLLFSVLPDIPTTGKQISIFQKISSTYTENTFTPHVEFSTNSDTSSTWSQRFGRLTEDDTLNLIVPCQKLHLVNRASVEIKKVVALETYLLVAAALRHTYAELADSFDSLGFQLEYSEYSVKWMNTVGVFVTASKFLAQLSHLLPGQTDTWIKIYTEVWSSLVLAMENQKSAVVATAQTNSEANQDTAKQGVEMDEDGPKEEKPPSLGLRPPQPEVTPELLVQLLRPVIYSHHLYLCLPMVARILQESSWSSWHRLLLIPSLLKSLSLSVVTNFIQEVYNTMELQWKTSGTDNRKIKLSTIKYIPQLLNHAAFLSISDLSTYFTKPIQLIPQADIFKACAKGFIDTFLQDHAIVGESVEVWNSMNFFVEIAARYNENIPVSEQDWELIAEGKEALPEFNDSRPLFDLLVQYTPSQLPRSVHRRWGETLNLLFQLSKENNNHWMKQFARRYDCPIPTDNLVFPPLYGHVASLPNVVTSWYQHLSDEIIPVILAALNGDILRHSLRGFFEHLNDTKERWRLEPDGMALTKWEKDLSIGVQNYSLYVDLMLKNNLNASLSPQALYKLLFDVANTHLHNQYSIDNNPPLQAFTTILNVLRPKFTIEDEGDWFKYSRRMLEDLAKSAESLPMFQRPSFITTFDLYLLPFPNIKPFKDDPDRFTKYSEAIREIFRRIEKEYNGSFVYFKRTTTFISRVSLYRQSVMTLDKEDLMGLGEAILNEIHQSQGMTRLALASVLTNILVDSILTWSNHGDAIGNWVRELRDTWMTDEMEEIRELAWCIKGKRRMNY